MKTKFIAILASLLCVATLFSCSNDDEKEGGNYSILDTWEYHESMIEDGDKYDAYMRYTFNEDNTMDVWAAVYPQGESEPEFVNTDSGTYTYSDLHLTMTVNGNTANVNVSFSNSGRTMTLSDETYKRTFTRK